MGDKRRDSFFSKRKLQNDQNGIKKKIRTEDSKKKPTGI